MIDASFLYIHSWLAQYGITALFFLGFFEEIFFFIPSSLLFVALGFLIIDPHAALLSALGAAFLKVSIVTSLGVTAGALVMYGFVYWGGKPIIERYGKYARVSWHDIARFGRWFGQGYKDEAVLVFFRAIPIFPITVVSIFCGLIRITLWEFIWTTFVGSIPRVTALALVGWYLGKEYAQYAEQIAGVERYGFIFFIAITIACAWYCYSLRRRR